MTHEMQEMWVIWKSMTWQLGMRVKSSKKTEVSQVTLGMLVHACVFFQFLQTPLRERTIELRLGLLDQHQDHEQ